MGSKRFECKSFLAKLHVTNMITEKNKQTGNFRVQRLGEIAAEATFNRPSRKSNNYFSINHCYALVMRHLTNVTEWHTCFLNHPLTWSCHMRAVHKSISVNVVGGRVCLDKLQGSKNSTFRTSCADMSYTFNVEVLLWSHATCNIDQRMYGSGLSMRIFIRS